MKLTRQDLGGIMKDFPNIELSYEKRMHKKVPSSNIYIGIPKGTKHFAWFRNWQRHSLCIFLELARNKKSINKIFIKAVSFDSILCSGKGTILYGTLFHVDGSPFFSIEDIFYMKGANISHINQCQKINALVTLFTDHIRQLIITKHEVCMGLPLMETDHKLLSEKILKLPYHIYCIQHRQLYKRAPFLNEVVTVEQKFEQIFYIKATVDPDIYALYYNGDGGIIRYKLACIPDYKTSVYMNDIFRDIKENKNLDRLEESDDDEEFENISADKYVDLEKMELFQCVYVRYYKSWKPIKMVTTGRICSSTDILKLEKYNAR